MYSNQMLRFEQSYTLEEKTHTMQINEFYNKYVDFNQTQNACRKCETYDKNWSCPPFQEDVLHVWKKYEKIDLKLMQLKYDEFITENNFSNSDIDTILHLTLFNEKRKMLQKLHQKIIEEEYTDAMILSTGYCNICPQCTKIENRPCRYPKNKLYSMESLGTLVTKTTEEIFDVKIKWIDKQVGKIPSYLTLLMGLLY